MSEPLLFNEMVHNAMRSKNMSAQKLVEETEIAPSHVRAFLDGDLESLPATPYVQGYIKKICAVLEIPFEDVWQQYLKETSPQRSGEHDRLPKNRFAITPVNKRGIVIAIIVIGILAIVVPQIADFFGKPGLDVISPAQNNIRVEETAFIIRGTVSDTRDKVLINGEEITVRDDGVFSKEVLLQSGPNTYTITAQRFLGKKTTITRTILYEAPLPSFSPIPATSTLEQ